MVDPLAHSAQKDHTRLPQELQVVPTATLDIPQLPKDQQTKMIVRTPNI